MSWAEADALVIAGATALLWTAWLIAFAIKEVRR